MDSQSIQLTQLTQLNRTSYLSQLTNYPKNKPPENIKSSKVKSSSSKFKEIYLQEEMPREKLLNRGVQHLTTTELLALLLKTGTKEKNVLELSREVISTFSAQELLNSSIDTLSQIKGISTAKACEIVAAFELTKRVQEQIHFKESFSSSQEIYEYVKHSLENKTHEEMRVLYLNVKNKLIKDEVLATGSIHFVHIDVRKIVKKALDLSASSIILIHNHPSGDTEESQADVEITTHIVQACELFHIKVLDHLIVGKNSYLSFYDSGVPPFT